MSAEEIEEIFGIEYWKGKDHKGNVFSVDKLLAGNLLMSIHWAKHYKDDRVFFIDGPEGSGKTTLAIQCARLIDPSFDENKIVYNAEDLKARYYNGKDYEVIVYDESDEGVNRMEFAKKGNLDFNKFMKQSRQARKILIMCGPSFYDISSYIAQHRVKILVHCYKQRNVHPGHFMFFNEGLIHKLFLLDKRYREYNHPPNFIGSFSARFVIDDELYNLKKRAAFMKFRPGSLDAPPMLSPAEAVLRWKMARVLDWPTLKDKAKGLTVKDFCTVLSISRKQLRDWSTRGGVEIVKPRTGTPANLRQKTEKGEFVPVEEESTPKECADIEFNDAEEREDVTEA